MRKLFNFKIGGDETTPNIKGENIFLHNSFFVGKTICFFYFKQCVYNKKIKKKSQPKKIVRKTMNFGSTNWLKKKKSRTQ